MNNLKGEENMAKKVIDVSAFPSGLTKKELIKRPEMKGIRSWFNWAGVVQILTGLATIGQFEELRLQGYLLNEQYVKIFMLFSIVGIVLGIALLVTKSTVIACAVGILGILMAICALASGGRLGAGIIATILAIVGGVRAEKTWKQYLTQSGNYC